MPDSVYIRRILRSQYPNPFVRTYLRDIGFTGGVSPAEASFLILNQNDVQKLHLN